MARISFTIIRLLRGLYPRSLDPCGGSFPIFVIYLVHGLVPSDEGASQFLTRIGNDFTVDDLLLVDCKSPNGTKDDAGRFACVLGSMRHFGVGTTLSLPGFSSQVKVVSGAERVTVEGYDANSMAITLALGVLALIGLCLNGTLKNFLTNVSALMMTLPLAVAIVGTGSRSGVVVLVTGFLIYLLPLRKSHRIIGAWSLAAIGLAGLVWLLLANPDFSRRWEQVVYEGSTAGRDKIYQIGFEMFLERPFFGWGHVESREELGVRVNHSWSQRDPA